MEDQESVVKQAGVEGRVTESEQEEEEEEVRMRRPPHQRIFVNRSVYMENIKLYGFDMDYTVAMYRSPQYETLIFTLGKELLVERGYPQQILDYKYDSYFPVRGLWFDSQYGTLLKADAYGHVLVCVLGFRFLDEVETERLYPGLHLQLDDQRVYVLNTLFHLPEMYLLACVVDHLNSSVDYRAEEDGTGVRSGDLRLPYHSVYMDVRAAVSYLHDHGALKERTLRDLPLYVDRHPLIALALGNIARSGARLFLLTNSDFHYTDGVMTYLLGPDWREYFDIVMVDANKPLFWGEGTVLRQVDELTGRMRLGTHVGRLRRGSVYSGGSCDVFMQLAGVRGRQVLYFGDHLFGDLLRSKKSNGWRTFLVVPEVEHELRVWTRETALFAELQRLELRLQAAYRDMDSASGSLQPPDVAAVRRQVGAVRARMNAAYGLLGSVFRSGSRTTFFSEQVMRYADLYAAAFYNVAHYPLTYMFRAPPLLMAHESTVRHGQRYASEPSLVRRRTSTSDRPCSAVFLPEPEPEPGPNTH